ncbi:ATP-binding response regulator [Rhodobium gokarnense]|uniref:histidine kinase n=1 Tax=Rhodobium gokarnense TaxID=364296 RepID=A0ABT3HE89_9HYPH|nr:ATP-binding protein [Rhodobium gokarnense]MCW2308711.1 CheY-like chemotaxis protein [Rhodobium gokarnense]
MTDDSPDDKTPAVESKVAEEDAPFLAVIGHELRTPLAAMMTAADLLGETSLTERQRGYLKTLKQAAEGSLMLAELLLAVGRRGPAGVREEAAAFEPAAVIGSVVDLFRPLAGHKGLEMAADLPAATHRRVSGRPKTLRQAVTALLDNAVKYSDRGTVALQAELAGGDGGSADLVVTIRDSGPGIAGSERARVFEAFQRGTGADGISSGYGLGLWITAKLAEAAGGSLGLSDDVEAGASFRLHFPVEVLDAGGAEPDVDVEASAMPDAAPAERQGLSGARFLVVDDNALGRRLIAACLDGFGATYRMAASGGEALEALRSERFDAVLMDIRMPDMSGVDVARHIATMAAPPPVIGLSADVPEPGSPAADETLFAAFIAKPFQPAALHERLTEVLARADA